ncbi:MAG TPA: DUF3562 domain-containing protein [Gaiellaceae bacterium]|nr:DUF3562 domain-containing protein [Gaiellaceae bacterium]
MKLTTSAAKQIEHLPETLHEEFPDAPVSVIEHDIEARVRDLIADAHFDDYVPLLVHKSVRERLRKVSRRTTRRPASRVERQALSAG